MVQVAGHLGIKELQAGCRSSRDVTLARHFQVIWLLAQGRSVAETAGLTGFARRWVEQLLARYNAFGPGSLGDRRRRNGSAPRLLTPAVLAHLKERVRTPPDDGGVWTAKKVARSWPPSSGLHRWPSSAAGRHSGRSAGRSSGRGRGMCGRRARRSRRRLKKLAEVVAEEAARHPGAVIETFATDEHRIGLKPITRRVWAPRGERPVAPCHHRFEWLYDTAFVSPATGASFWYLSTGVDKALFAETLALFAREAGAGRDRIIILVLDGAGWHTAPGLAVPDGIRLVYLPPYTPELQPAETLWTHVDAPIANRHFETLRDLDAAVAARCIALTRNRDLIRSQTGFHWWPERLAPT